MDTPTEQVEDRHPPISRRERKSRWVRLACVGVVIVALLGGSLFELLYSGKSTGRVVTDKNLSTATATPTWVPTEITPPAESTFYDTFINNKHGWSLSGTGGDLRILTNNQLILADTNPDTTLIESIPTNNALSDYVISTDFTLNNSDGRDSTGLYLRGDSHLDHDYRIDINGNKTVDIVKEWLDTTQTPQNTMLVAPRATKLLNPPGTPNTLTVFMIDQSITVLLNNVAVATVTDSAYTSGQAALFVHHGNRSKGAIYSFSRVEIDRLASPFATPTPTPTPAPQSQVAPNTN